MPGSFITLVCPGCSAQHQVTTGAGYDSANATYWSYTQHVCPRCGTLRSVPDSESGDDTPPCEECGADLGPWPGRVWLDKDEDGHVGDEHVEGPCPRCEAQITLDNATELGLWD